VLIDVFNIDVVGSEVLMTSNVITYTYFFLVLNSGLILHIHILSTTLLIK